jgi:hypothetical protein
VAQQAKGSFGCLFVFPGDKMIVATETTRFAGRERNPPRGRNAEPTSRFIDATRTLAEPGAGLTIKGAE